MMSQRPALLIRVLAYELGSTDIQSRTVSIHFALYPAGSQVTSQNEEHAAEKASHPLQNM